MRWQLSAIIKIEQYVAAIQKTFRPLCEVRVIFWHIEMLQV